MNNKSIIAALKTTMSLMEIHGENDFKIKSFSNALFNLERHSSPLEKLNEEELAKIDGVGKSIAAKINELNTSGKMESMEALISKTPTGIIDMMSLKGFGAKKIKAVWKELNVESIDNLLAAIEEGKLAKLKGFGQKTQDNIKEAILFQKKHEGKLLYAEAEPLVKQLEDQLTSSLPNAVISVSGAYRRKMEILEVIEFVIAHDNSDEVYKSLEAIEDLVYLPKVSGPFIWKGELQSSKVKIHFRVCTKKEFYKTLFLSSSAPGHIYHNVKDGKNFRQLISKADINSEEEIYRLADISYVEPELREGLIEFDSSQKDTTLLEMKDLKGILHNHCTYSDGQHTLEEMAVYCKELGYEYLGITDHSKSSFHYANGLYENRVKEQQEEIDELNKKLAPFRIFKGIECDILPDGSLDYSNEVLASFDFIVSSIHSSMNMDVEKATNRLIRAIENPFTTILGHSTGRLLLKRDGYPIDHKKVIDACAEHNVTIEVNANPRRLDIDWRWIPYAMEKGVKLSINPDAHKKEGYADMYYGVCVARKGGLTKEMNLNSLSLDELTAYFDKRKEEALGKI